MRHRGRGLTCAAVVSLGVSWAGPGHAVPVTLTLSGVVDSSTIGAFIGSVWSLVVSYESSTSASVDSGAQVVYEGYTVESFSVSGAPPGWLPLPGPNFLVIEDGPTRDLILVEAQEPGPPAIVLSISLSDEDAEVFDSTRLPDSDLDLAIFEGSDFELLIFEEGRLDVLQGSVQGLSLVVVPEASPSVLLAFGSLLLAWGRRAGSAAIARVGPHRSE